MEGTLTSIIELVAAVAIMVMFGGVFKQDKHDDDDQLKPIRVPVTYKYQRRIRR